MTFTCSVTDGISPELGTALVTLAIPAPPMLVVPSNYTFETHYETPISSNQTSNLLAGIQSADPSRPIQLVVKGVKTAPPAGEGSVAVAPDGSYTFVPAPGFSGERVAWPAAWAFTTAHTRPTCKRHVANWPTGQRLACLL